MKKIIIVNNNMKVGGVQKSLYNLLWSVSDQYEITLYLFSRNGEYVDQLPENVRIEECSSLFRFFGISQNECGRGSTDYWIRSILAVLCRIFGRRFVIRIALASQKHLSEKYDIAISYLQNGRTSNLYGGTNEFVLKKIEAEQKIAFLHCDYCHCGANHPVNNRLYYKFDKIAACSEGGRQSFIKALPELAYKSTTVRNFHRYEKIREMAQENPVEYEQGYFHVVMVGRLAHEKGVERALKATVYVKENAIPVVLHIVGDGKMMSELKQTASLLKLEEHVVFYGEQKNPYRFMVNADLLLLTSYHEAAPMVIDEAYALGLPVLTVETTSSMEMVTERAGGWVCNNSQQGINEALAKVLGRPEILRKKKKDLAGMQADNTVTYRQFKELIGE